MWENSDYGSDFEEAPEFPLHNPTENRENPLATWLVIFLLQLQARYFIPNAAVDVLVKFLSVFLSVLGRYSQFLANMACTFPKSLHELQRKQGLLQDFQKFVVCHRCNSIYNFSECIERVGSQTHSRKCNSPRYPNDRRKCETLLLKNVQLGNGQNVLRPYKLYCYNSLFSSLQNLLKLQSFVELVEHWRTRDSNGALMDVYDGQVWKDFMIINGIPFLAEQFTFALALNIDWFQPYKLTESSVGAIYLTVFNLPYYARFKREFVILLGIIPGPSEPKRDVNSFLRPLVSELLDLWKGVPMHAYGYSEKQNVRCALICVASDMPASRKACGFLGHTARLGCSKCKKQFAGGFGNSDYSGFDRSSWPLRNIADHRASINLILQAKTKSERDKLESRHGCRYSVLLDLPYFDPIRMTVIDPMHNLFLGTAKHIVKKVWIERNFIAPGQFDGIQEKISSFKTPLDIGRIPRKIETGFAGFTADQFKNWTVLFSIPCLKDVLNSDDLECWRHFVLAARILCQHTLTESQIDLADILLLRFCQRVERMYGKSVITPNMHMHCHYKQMLLDYGPVYSFWCFSYERYNGMLGAQPTNNKNIETQLMKPFLQDNLAFSFTHPSELSDSFGQFFLSRINVTGSVRETIERPSKGIDLPKQYQHTVLDSSDKTVLQEMIGKMHECPSFEITINSIACKYKSLNVNGRRLSAIRSSSCVALAQWERDLFGSPQMSSSGPLAESMSESFARPVHLNYFVKVLYRTAADVLQNKQEFHVFGNVSWYCTHPGYSSFGKPVQLWCNDIFEHSNFPTFIPVHLLSTQCVHCVIPYTCNENVLLVVPIVN